MISNGNKTNFYFISTKHGEKDDQAVIKVIMIAQHFHKWNSYKN